MISCLLQVKDSLVQVTYGMGWDCLLPGEWQRLTLLRDLLRPSAEHTLMLQSDTMSLSQVVPVLLDLSALLSKFPQPQGSNHRDLAFLAQKMKANINQRCFLDPSDLTFSPLTTACFLNSTVSPEALIENDDEQIQELTFLIWSHQSSRRRRLMKIRREKKEGRHHQRQSDPDLNSCQKQVQADHQDQARCQAGNPEI